MASQSPKNLFETDYLSYLNQKSGKELLQILNSIDRGSFPDRHALVREELSKRGYDLNDLSLRGTLRKLANDLVQRYRSRKQELDERLNCFYTQSDTLRNRSVIHTEILIFQLEFTTTSE